MPMVRPNSGAVLRQIQALLDAGTSCGLSDGQLLERFLARRDEVSELAFTVLVEPVGTVKSRLSRARARLRQRLARRGLAPPDLSIAMPFLPTALPRALVEATTRAAHSLIAGRMATAMIASASVTTLTEGVLRTML